jgi:hypothetical protein
MLYELYAGVNKCPPAKVLQAFKHPRQLYGGLMNEDWFLTNIAIPSILYKYTANPLTTADLITFITKYSTAV